MAKHTKQSNHDADIQNPNKGTSGTNKTYDKNQGNRGRQRLSVRSPIVLSSSSPQCSVKHHDGDAHEQH